MLRSIVFISFALAVMTAAASARQRHLDPTPFSHTPCSVLDGEPCVPSTCSVFDRGPCLPEIDYPVGQNLQVTVLSVPGRDDAAKYRKPDGDLDTITDLFAVLRSCWSPPADTAGSHLQISVSFSFKRSGELLGAPRLTFATPGASTASRVYYLDAIKASLQACLPLSFTAGLGGAIAGRPIMVRYVDNRDLEINAK